MLIVISIAAAGALAVVAYTRLRQYSPETGAAGLRAVQELAAIIVLSTKAVEGIVDVLAGAQRLQSSPMSASWGHRTRYGYEEDEP